jgi:hypothetical protein
MDSLNYSPDVSVTEYWKEKVFALCSEMHYIIVWSNVFYIIVKVYDKEKHRGLLIRQVTCFDHESWLATY